VIGWRNGGDANPRTNLRGRSTPEQYGYRKDRSALDAVRRVHQLVNTGIARSLTPICLPTLTRSTRRTSSVASPSHCRWSHAASAKDVAEAPVEEIDDRGHRHRSTRNRDEGKGTPQGSPISPLFSNLYMRRFVLGWKQLGYDERLEARIVSYADDFVICCGTERNRL